MRRSLGEYQGEENLSTTQEVENSRILETGSIHSTLEAGGISSEPSPLDFIVPQLPSAS